MAAVVVLNADGSYPDAYLVMHTKERVIQNLSNLDKNVEPLVYPIFYPKGDTKNLYDNYTI